MKASLLALVPVLAFAQDPAAPAAEKPAAEKPAALAAVERTAELHDRFGASFVEVAWRLRRDEEGRSPARSMPYRCPNCGGIHYRNLDSLISENRAFATPGFALAADRFLAYDPKFRTSGVERVEIRLPADPSKAWPARAVASSPDRGALLLATDEPLPGVKPLAFDAAGALPDEPAFFFVAREDGMLTTGVRTKSASDCTRLLGLGRDFVRGVENALLLNASNEAVTVSFRDRYEVGAGGFEAPAESAAALPAGAEERGAGLEGRLRRAPRAASRRRPTGPPPTRTRPRRRPRRSRRASRAPTSRSSSGSTRRPRRSDRAAAPTTTTRTTTRRAAATRRTSWAPCSPAAA